VRLGPASSNVTETSLGASSACEPARGCLVPTAPLYATLDGMEARSRRITTVYSGVAAVAAFVTQPVPALDELIVVPIHYRFVFKMARTRGVKVRKLPWRVIQKIIWYGAAARLVGNFSLGLVPVVGMFSNAITAVALTEYLARYLDQVIDNPDMPAPDISVEQLKQLFATAVQKNANGKGAPAARAPAPQGEDSP
jgi:uncharacterized protein (DUF697 family)